MRALFRVATAALLLASLLWFSSRLNVLPTRQAILQHVLPLTESTKPSVGSSKESLLTSTEVQIEQDSPLRVGKPVLVSTTALAAKPSVSAKAKHPLVAILEEVSESLDAAKLNAYTGPPGDKIVVIGRLQSEDTTWVAEELPEYVI